MSAELIVNFAVALVGIIALLALMPAMLRWVQNHPRFQGIRGSGRRLDVLEAKMIDARRRLVLVRRDKTEHLLLIGGETDIVIEQNIPPASIPDAGHNKNKPSMARGQDAAHQD